MLRCRKQDGSVEALDSEKLLVLAVADAVNASRPIVMQARLPLNLEREIDSKRAREGKKERERDRERARERERERERERTTQQNLDLSFYPNCEIC